MNSKIKRCQWKNSETSSVSSSILSSSSESRQSKIISNEYDSASKIPDNHLAFPSTVDIDPNLYYYTKNGLASLEENNIYYKISNLKNNNKISNYINSKLKYTSSRENFERVEKLRFRLPTTEEFYLKSKEASAEDIETRIEKVKQFRENNFNICVSEEEQEFRNTHKCVHRYKLNDRGMPEPVLKDEDGNSLCSDPTCYTASAYLIENNITPINCEKRFVVPEGKGEDYIDKFNGYGPVLLLEASTCTQNSNEKSIKPKFNTRDTFPVPDSLALKYQRRKY